MNSASRSPMGCRSKMIMMMVMMIGNTNGARSKASEGWGMKRAEIAFLDNKIRGSPQMLLQMQQMLRFFRWLGFLRGKPSDEFVDSLSCLSRRGRLFSCFSSANNSQTASLDSKSDILSGRLIIIAIITDDCSLLI